MAFTLDCRPNRPASLSPDDVEASIHSDGYRNRWFFDPVFGLGYPDDMVSRYPHLGRIDGLDWIHPREVEAIATPVDFLGLNYYTSVAIKAGEEEGEHPESQRAPTLRLDSPKWGGRTLLRRSPSFCDESTGTIGKARIYITENGASYSDSG